MKTKLFFISLLAILSLASCSNFVESLQKNKPTGAEQQGQQNGQDQSQKPQVQPEVFYNITFADFENGGISSSKTTGIKAGEEIILSVEAEKGYVFKSLTVYNAQNKDVAIAQIVAGSSFKFTMPNSDVTVKVVFEAKPQNQQTGTEEQNQQTTPDEQTQQPDNNEQSQQTGTEQQNQQTTPDDTTTQPPAPTGPVRYRVEHYQQDVDGSDTYELYAIQEKRGEAGSDTAASAKDYPGFTAQAFEQPKIAADGSTIVRIYYNRKTITYTFNPNGGNWDGSTDVVEVSGLFGNVVNITNPVKIGYSMTWSSTVPELFGPDNITYTANWTPNTNTPYRVRIYLQNIEGGDNYTLEKEEVLHGTTDTNTYYSATYINGFMTPFSINQENINADGSTILDIYYTRIAYTVTFVTNGGNSIENQQILYQASPTVIPVREGYTFCNWYYDSEFTNPYNTEDGISQNSTLYALWKDNSIKYEFHENIEILTGENKNGTFGPDGDYVLFGDYPQSLISENVSVDENKLVKMGTMSVYGGSDGNLYYKKKDKYYKVEPIKWRIISRDADNRAVLLAEKIMLRFQFLPHEHIYNFFESVESFLIYDFLDVAFTSFAINNRIVYSDVPDPCDPLYVYSIKVFLFALDDIFENTSCFPSASSRIREFTECVLADVANPRTNWWWLNAFEDSLGKIWTVSDQGFNYSREYGTGGIVPAITVKLPEED